MKKKTHKAAKEEDTNRKQPTNKTQESWAEWWK